MKKKFIIEQSRPVIQVWTFEVDAETEEEAIEMIENGDVEVSNHDVVGDGHFGYEDCEYDVIDIQETPNSDNTEQA